VKVEAGIFLNHRVYNIAPGTCTHRTERGCHLALFYLPAPNYFGLQLLLETIRTFQGYLLPHVTTFIRYSLSYTTTAPPSHLTSPQPKLDTNFFESKCQYFNLGPLELEASMLPTQPRCGYFHQII
jgi:hypothetical protein